MNSRLCGCPMLHRHGTLAMYEAHKCACFACRLHRADRRYRLRHGLPQDGGSRFMDNTGTVRRLQALAAIGVPLPAIAERLGVTMQAVHHARSRPCGERVRVDLAARVAAVYDELWDAPTEMRQVKTCNAAMKHGWVVPLAWDDIDDPAATPDLGESEPVRGVREWRAKHVDEIAVERIMDGTLYVPAHAFSPERTEAVRRLAGQGMSDYQIGQRLRCTAWAVQRTRERNDIPAGVACTRREG